MALGHLAPRGGTAPVHFRTAIETQRYAPTLHHSGEVSVSTVHCAVLMRLDQHIMLGVPEVVLYGVGHLGNHLPVQLGGSE